MNKKHFIPYTQLSLAMVIVGSATVFGKLIISELPVYLASFLSLIFASIIFLPHVFSNTKDYVNITRNDLFTIFLQAFLGTFLYRILLLYGLNYVSATEAGIFTSTLPAVVAILAIMILKEKITHNALIGIGLTVAGLAIVGNFSGLFLQSPDLGLLLGSGLIFASVFCEALFSVLAKRLHSKVNPVAQSGLVIFISTLLFSPFAIFELRNFNLLSISLSGWFAVIYYGLFVTVISFVLWFKGLKKVKALNSGVFMGLIPISAIILSYLILGEFITIKHILGSILIIAGILFTQKRSAYEK